LRDTARTLGDLAQATIRVAVGVILLGIMRKELKMRKVLVTVSGGCAHLVEDTLPSDVEVEIVDFDNIEEGDGFPSDEAREYCESHGLYGARRAT
jgi:hypothetical protein